MAEIQLREVKTLKALLQMTEPVTPGHIAEMVNEMPLNIGRSLRELAKSGLAELIDKEGNTWQITDKGKEVIANLQATTETVPPLQTPETVPPGQTIKGKRLPETPPQETGTIPSQADIFRAEGERLGVGTRKGDILLDVIVNYVQRIANLDDLNSVWNALTEMNVADNVKKRWIKLYAQNLPGKQIPSELKEKLEAGQEDKVPSEGKLGEVAPKPKRFSVINDQIIGDPEGDYNFKEALQLIATQKGVPAAQADPLASMIEAMKLGPEMATATMTAMIPLITRKDDTSQGNIWLQFIQTQQQNAQNQIQMFQTLITNLTEEKHKAELATVSAQIEAIKTGQRSPESNEQIKQLAQTIETMRESLHQAQIDGVKEQSQRNVEALQGEIRRLEERIAAVGQGKKLEGSLAILDKGIDKASEQLSGLRSDVKTGLETIIKSGGLPQLPRTAEERAKLSRVGKQAVETEKRADEIERKVLGLG